MDVMKQAEVDSLENILFQKGYSHLKVKARGQHLTIYSEQEGDKEPRLRLTVLPAGKYGLSFATHTGKWERTPFVGNMQEILDIIEAQFGWHLEVW